MGDSKTTAIAVALIGAAGAITAAIITIQPWSGDSSSNDRPAIEIGDTATSVFLSRDSGPSGTSVNVSGEGFAAGERVVIRFHNEQIGSTTANAEGRFSNVAVTIPDSFSQFAPQQFQVIASGDSSLRSAMAPFTIT